MTRLLYGRAVRSQVQAILGDNYLNNILEICIGTERTKCVDVSS